MPSSSSSCRLGLCEFFSRSLTRCVENVVPTWRTFADKRFSSFFSVTQDAVFTGARENGTKRRGKSTINLRPFSSSPPPLPPLLPLPCSNPRLYSACIHNEVGEKAAEGETGGRGGKRGQGGALRGETGTWGGKGNMRGIILALSCKMAFPVELDAVPLQ